VAAGGEGAPLVPAYHRALAESLDQPRPIAVLNVGGVANVTYIDTGDPVACDTGPGNALLDDFMRTRTGRAHDDGGALAATGRVDEALIARTLSDPFFSRAPPKSLDRNAFTHVDVGAMSTPDGAATLTALTAAAVARAVALLPRPPRTFIVAGGGAHNHTLLAMLKARLAPATVEAADAAGWSADALEAQAFAFLAVRKLKGLPITFPTTTGVRQPLTGGILVKPDK
jgi:anhydro-N-acetylmuramic acid kinase